MKTSRKTIIVPVAIPRCGTFFLSFFRRKFIVESDVRFLIGKTLVPIATKHLFVFGTLRTTMWMGRNPHLVSSGMWGSYWRNTMWSSLTSTWPLIILLLYYQSLTLWYPRSNHTRQHRDPLCEIAQKSKSSIRFLVDRPNISSSATDKKVSSTSSTLLVASEMFQLFTDFSTSIAAILHITHRKHISKTGWVLNLLTSSVECCTERYRFRYSAKSYTFLRASKAIYDMLYLLSRALYSGSQRTSDTPKSQFCWCTPFGSSASFR